MKERKFWKERIAFGYVLSRDARCKLLQDKQKKHFVGMCISGKTMEMSEIHSKILEKAINDNEKKISST